MNSEFSPEMLNAYIDGELSASESARVANAVAVDAELARQVAVLSSLKAVVASSNCGLKESFNINLDKPVKKHRRITWAAAVAGLVAMGLLLVTLVLSNESLLPSQGLQFAEVAHKNWLTEQDQTFSLEFQRSSFGALNQLQIDAYVPDLSKVNLVFSGIRRISSSAAKGVHIGYQGPSGCMVSLVLLNHTVGLSPELAYFEKGEHFLYGWQVKDTGFYLLAYKMDPSRLMKVARVVNRLTRERLPLDSESIIALKDARSTSKPCLA
ncbi:MAG: hypothetical protein OEY09_10200 [Gammaproteobacteria bacterium]|nr:hypothetical protein [Gammaproteobacteria bacterium]